MNEEVHFEAPANDMGQAKKPMVGVKTAIGIVIIIILGALAYFYRGFFIAATVNGRVISRFAIIKNLEKQQGATVLDSLITEELIQEEARKRAVMITDADIDAELKKIEDMLSSQGNTLEAALKAQGLSREELRKQIGIQKTVEKLLAGKIDVSESEIDEYIKVNSMTAPAGEEGSLRAKVHEQIQSQKFSKEAGVFVDGLRSSASITRLVNY